MKTLYTAMVFAFLTLGCCPRQQDAQRAGFSGPKTDYAMMDATDASDAARENPELRRKLRRLIEQWDRHRNSTDVMVSSDFRDMFDSEAYLRMVKLGRPVLPLIVEEMKRGHGLLFHVVMDITELTPRDLEKKLGVSWQGDITDLYPLWWQTEGQEACQADPNTQDAGKIEFKQLTSYRWIEEEWGA